MASIASDITDGNVRLPSKNCVDVNVCYSVWTEDGSEANYLVHGGFRALIL